MRNFLVQESYRSSGVGKLLFNELIKHAKESGCNRIEFDVKDWNIRAQKFYENLGAENVTEKEGCLTYRVYKDGIDKIAAC